MHVNTANRLSSGWSWPGVLAIWAWTPWDESRSLRWLNSGAAFFILNASDSGSTRPTTMWPGAGARMRLFGNTLV